MKLFLSTLLISLSFSSFGWTNYTNEQDGFTVSIDYQKTAISYPDGCYKCQGQSYATPLYVNVSGPRVTGHSKVRVIITNEIQTNYSSWIEKNSYVMDLEHQHEGHFSAPFSDARKLFGDSELEGNYSLTIRSTGYGGTYKINQLVGVVVDGHWLQDFRLNMWNN